MKICCGNIDILTLFLFDVCFRLVCFRRSTLLQFLLFMSVTMSVIMPATMSVAVSVTVAVATFVFEMATFVRMAVVMIMVMSWSLM